MDDLNLVLLVEDDPQDVIIVRRFLNRARRRRFSVRHVRRLGELPDALQTTVPDVLLCDLTLPDASGIEMVHAAVRCAPDTPLIVLTGVEDEEIGLKALQVGAQDYLVKGECDARELERAIIYAIERKRLMRQVEHAAMYDALTGLPNRSLLVDRMRMAAARCLRTGEAMYVVRIDIDDFKAVNTALSAASGDVLLSLVARRLVDSVHPAETVARFGGDEFVCVLDAGSAGRAVVDHLVQRITEPYRLFSTDQPDGREVELKLSVGVVRFPGDAETAEGLLAVAGDTVQAAKLLGGARVSHAEDIEPTGATHAV